jgi:aspartate racemase
MSGLKKLGIVGGLAWRSTVTYYSEYCGRAERWHVARGRPGAPAAPELVIESLDLNRAFALIGRDGDVASWAAFDDYHRAALRRLQAAGADFALRAANTPHHRLDAITRGVELPVVSILEALARAAAGGGARAVLLLGTAVTMASDRFAAAFARHGIVAAGPRDPAVRERTAALITELQGGAVAGAAARVSALVAATVGPQFAAPPLVCLACTELPLAFPGSGSAASFEAEGVRYLNSVPVHVEAAFACAAGAAR